MRGLHGVLALVLGGLAAAPAAAQTPPDSGAFIARLGTDTLSIERYVRTADRLESEALLRVPDVARARLTIRFGAGGRVAGIEAAWRAADAPPDAPPARRLEVTFDGDSATVVTTQGESTRTRRVAGGPGAVPLLSPFYAPYELLLSRAGTAGAGEAVLEVFTTGGTATFGVRRAARDSAVITDPTFGSRRVRVDRAGRLAWFEAAGSPHGTIVERTPWPDLDALARRFAGRGLGPLSPRDTARATVHGASLMVDYSRPAKRGRVVFGGVVPWNEVWRTGANQATHFRTDRSLRIGDVTIPAGTYTLYTIPAPSAWTLIVSRQTDQWGTEYDASQDLARLEMKVETLPTAVEEFTISFEEGAGRGVLKMAWDRTLASIPFRVE